MRFLLRVTIATLIVSGALSLLTPVSAHAHGVGGVQAQNSTARVIRVEPPTKGFTIASIENGERVELTRTGNTDITVLGVDGEPYLLINDEGVFENELSATRLINRSTENAATEAEFAQTSSDPKDAPEWNKISSSQTHRFHDHRAHYMGSDVDAGVDLGESTFSVQSGNTKHTVTFKLETSTRPSPLFYFAAMAIGAILLFAISRNPKLSHIVFSNTGIIVMSCTIAIAEIIHITGYMTFVHQPLIEEISGSLYGLAVVIVATSTAIIFFRHRKSPAPENWNRHAPILCGLGFMGFVAGTASEYSVFMKAYLPTTLDYTVARILITSVGIISLALLALGLSNVTKSTSSHPRVAQDSDS